MASTILPPVSYLDLIRRTMECGIPDAGISGLVWRMTFMVDGSRVVLLSWTLLNCGSSPSFRNEGMLIEVVGLDLLGGI